VNRREFISGVAVALLAAPTAPARLSGILCCHTTKVSQRAGITNAVAAIVNSSTST